MNDPYVALWRKILSQYDRLEDLDDALEMGGGFAYKCACHEAEEIEAEEYTLPLRGVRIAYDGDDLIVDGQEKRVTGATHAINALRKLDNDDNYFHSLVTVGNALNGDDPVAREMARDAKKNPEMIGVLVDYLSDKGNGEA